MAKIVSNTAGFGDDPGPQIFEDVVPGSIFYTWINRLNLRNVVQGYPCGTRQDEPCDSQNRPYFRTFFSVTRGEATKFDDLAFFPSSLAPGVGTSSQTTPMPGGKSPALPPAVPSVPPPLPTDVATPPPCPAPNCGEFSDVLPDNTFFTQIRCLACRGIMTGYECGSTPGEPCDCSNTPYFRTSTGISRQEMAKIVSLAAGFNEDPGTQYFEDMTPDLPLYPYVNRLGHRGIVSGYPCGTTPDEPCGIDSDRPYFRPTKYMSRGEGAKIVSNSAGFSEGHTEQTYADVPPDCNPLCVGSSFYIYIQRLTSRGVVSGYACGGVNPQTGEPLSCDSLNRPYYLPDNFMTREQAAKIVSDSFFPGCQSPPDSPKRGPYAPGTGTASVPPMPSVSVTPAVSPSAPLVGSPSPVLTVSPSVVPTDTAQPTTTVPVPPAQPSVPPSVPSPVSTTVVQLSFALSGK